ncbi:peptidoglycan-binding protein [Paracoccus salsus]|uniref:peptidoglycan-binding protein n=1 Tax=Paracoccus salsus TaxID=2911061 RepID=UPI001F2B53E8|nr:peptidoglycan-binding protein [Paracoccus salsus]MCF3975100.1 peptidoglycan-binding protein [Paracoccus salsus]
MSIEQRMAVQRALADAGYYSGEIDGILGSGSRRAIANWQAALGAPATGYLLGKQAQALIATSPSPAPATPWPDAGARGAQAAPLTPAGAGPTGAARPEAGPVPLQQVAAPAKPADAILGDDALAQRLAVWVAARQPDILEDHGVVNLLILAGIAPEIRTRKYADPALKREALRAALPGPDLPPPDRVILEREVAVRPAWNGQPAVFDTRGLGPIIEGTPTLIDLPIRTRGPRRVAWTLRSAQPFYLPVPDGFEAWAIPGEDQRSKLLLQIDVSLSDLQPTITPLDRSYRGGTGTARINSVTLIRRAPAPSRADQPPLSDQLLHVWDRGDAPASSVPDQPANAAALVALYGGAESEGRWVPEPREQVFGGFQQRMLERDWGLDWYALPEALALRRLVEAGPDRLPDVALADTLAQRYLTPRQKLDLFPVEIAQRTPHSKVSELALHAAMTKNAAAVRDIAVSRAPDLPLPLRQVNPVYLGEYDFGIQGFALELGNWMSLHLPLAEPGPDMIIDARVILPPDRAQSLLERIAERNPSGAPGREIFFVVDYMIDEMLMRAPGAGPITEAELGIVKPRSRIERAALYLDPGLTEKILDVAVPEPPQRAVAAKTGMLDIPVDVLATTGRSLMGAAVAADPQDVHASYLIGQMLRGRGETGDLAAKVRRLRDEVAAEARERYWIAASMELGDYQPEQGRFPIAVEGLRAVPHDGDSTGMPPPDLGFLTGDLAELQVSPEEAAAIDSFRDVGNRIAAYLLVRPVEVGEDDYNGSGIVLKFDQPEAMLLGPDGGNGLPDPILLRVGAEPAPKAPAPTVAADGPTDPPDTLLLDQEGFDLLALSLDPDIYDDLSWRRMLVQRLMRERWFEAEPDPIRGDLAWGRFYSDPMATPDASGLTALLPSFRDWTMKRVAVLPDRLVMPIGAVPQGEPGCDGLSEIRAAEIGKHPNVLIRNAAAILGDLTTFAAEEAAITQDRARPGPDRLWLHDAPRLRESCRYHGRSVVRPLAGLVPQSASLVSGVVGTASMPFVGPEGHDASATAVTLRRDSVRLESLDGLRDLPEGLRGVVLVAGPAEQVRAWRGRIGYGMEQSLSLTPPDWAPLEAAPLVAADVVGLTTGMPLAAIEEAARAHLGEAVLFTETTPGKGMFGHARGLLNPSTGEAITAVYAPHAEGQPVVAIMRRLPLASGQTDHAALAQSLTAKYGPISREAFDGGWLWGLLPEGEDGWGVCGGESLLGQPEREMAPVLTPTADLGLPERSYHNRPDFWFEAGWPEVVSDRPGQIDPARCGPVVGAMVFDAPQNVKILQVWLMDRKLAEEHDALPKPAAQAADIKL